MITTRRKRGSERDGGGGGVARGLFFFSSVAVPLLLVLGILALTQQEQHHVVDAFSVNNIPIATTRIISKGSAASLCMVKKDWFAPDASDDDEDDDDDDDDDVVTREMLHRHLLNMEPKVMRKQQRKNGGTATKNDTKYKPLDNRDSLPFSVRNVSPDPYTHPDIKNSRRQTSPPLVGTKKKSSDLQTSLARIYYAASPAQDEDDDTTTTGGRSGKKGKTNKNDKKKKTKTKNDPSTLLGEFQLDKSTTSGDIIELGDQQFQVTTARCQYKYAGGQRFVMVRKILEVKEVTRIQKEEYLLRQYNNSNSLSSVQTVDQPPPLE